MINEGEESEGLKQTIDRKTIQRLVDKLESDGLIRIIRVNLKGHGKEKNMVFICHPTVTESKLQQHFNFFFLATYTHHFLKQK